MSKNKVLPIGDDWDEYKGTLLSEAEREEIDIRVNLITEIINARRARGLTQKELEKVSGVKQPVIARMEKGSTDPQLTTVLKVLHAMGKTLKIEDKA
ncbi:MAG: helix-turn-helix domain-containing protein [Lachnospiraceae bacterium]|nr:helix-turn-helix domain-containing protein [Lachnospiraceae bacterium]